MQENENIDTSIVSESDSFSFKDDGEPDVHASSEEHAEEEHIEHESEEEEDQPKPKKTKNVQTRINQIQREKYRAIHQAELASKEVEFLRQENERLKTSSDVANQASMIHYNETVRQRENSAKSMLAKAIETGDVNLQIEATEELASQT